jgi:hypothetical protein
MQPSWLKKSSVSDFASSDKLRSYVFLAGKKWSTEKLASRLEEAAEIIKATYR